MSSAPGEGPRRFPASVFQVGTEPDVRFTLANERTFLAWIRTSLAMTAAGVALEGLNLDLQPQLRMVASIVLITAGVATSVQAWRGWANTERALRLGEPLPSARPALPVAAAVAAVGVLLVLATIW